MPPIDFFTDSEQNKAQLAAFFKHYKIEFEVVCPDQKNALISKELRKCRYCGIQGPDKWKKEAHVFPHFLGNNTLFSDEECSQCNEKFSKPETNLAAFLGFSRTINQVKGKRGVPKFKSADKKVAITGDDYWYGMNSVNFERILDGNNNFKIDDKKGITEVIVTKETYVPLLAYKSLIKLAYSILPFNEILNYTSTLEFITTGSLDSVWKNACNINKVSFSFGIGTKSPFILLCKKVDESFSVPMHCVLFFWQNYFFQFSIPYHESDIKNFAGKPLNDILLPPFLFFSAEKIISTQEILNLGSPLEKKGEKELIRFKYDPSIPMIGYDPNTQQEIEMKFNPETITGIRLVKEKDFRLPIKRPPNS